MRSVKRAAAAVCLAVVAVSISTVLHARDRGINQPGAAGNAGPVGPDRDPGLNQPGAAGNVGGAGTRQRSRDQPAGRSRKRGRAGTAAETQGSTSPALPETWSATRGSTSPARPATVGVCADNRAENPW